MKNRSSEYHKLHQYRITNTLCLMCGGPRDSEKSACSRCLTKKSERRVFCPLLRYSTKNENIVKNITAAWIIQNNYPEYLQLLCANCNKAKGLYGECPHSISK